MANNDNILGTSAQITTDQSALDALEARAAENAQAQADSEAGIGAPENSAPMPGPLSANQQRQQMRTDALNDQLGARTQGIMDREAAATRAAQARADAQQARTLAAMNRVQMAAPPDRGLRMAAMEALGGQVDTRAEFEQFLPGFLADQGLATNSEMERLTRSHIFESLGTEPEQPLSPYAAAKRQVSEIDEDLRNDFTQSGRYDKIGGDEFQKERRERMAAKSLAAPEKGGLAGAFDRIREDKMGLAFGIGFSAISVGTGVASLAELGSGQYVSPEQQQRAQVNAVAPGAGGILGTLIGAAIGPEAGLAGQFIGGAAGQAGSAIFGASSEREETTRQAAETLAASLGAATSQVKNFADQITATGAPVKDFQTALASIGTVGTFGAGTTAGVGGLTSAFGEHSDANWAAIAKYSGNPLTPGLARRFSGGLAGSGDIDSLAYDAAENGDFGTLKQLQQAAGDARVKDDPQFKAAAKHLEDARNEQFGFGAAPVAFAGWAREHGIPVHNDLTDAMDTEDARRKALGPDPNVAEQNRIANEFADAKSRAIGAGANIDRLTAEGGSAADLAGARSAARGVLAGNIARYQADEANPLNKDRRDELDAKINSAQADVAKLNRSDFDDDLKEHTAGFSLAQVRAQIEGKSAADIQRQMNRQAAYLEGVQGPISPAERMGLDEQALKMRYSAKTAVYDEKLSRNDLATAQAGVGVARAEATGGPGEVYQAQQQMLVTYTARIRELTSELHSGGLAVADRIAKEKELSQTQAQAIQLESQARQQLYADRRGIAQDSLGALTDGLGRAITIGGNAAVTPQMIGEAGHSIAIDNDALAAAKTPAERARYRRQIADDTLVRDQLTTAQQTYAPDSANQTEDAELRGTQFRAARIGGQVARDAALGILQNDQRDLADLNRRDASATDPLARTANAKTRQQMLDDMAVAKTNSQLYSETVAEHAEDARISGAFRRSELAPFVDGPNSNPLTRGTDLINLKQRRLSSAQATLAKTDRDDPAFAANTDAVEGLQTELAELKRERLTGAFGALPEMVLGSPGGGVGAALITNAALSAFYTPGPEVGRWGQGGRSVSARSGVGVTTGAGGVSARTALHTDAGYHSVTEALGTGHGASYTGLLPGAGRAVIGRPGTPGYSGPVLEGTHGNVGHPGAHDYSGLLPPGHYDGNPFAHPAASALSWGGPTAATRIQPGGASASGPAPVYAAAGALEGGRAGAFNAAGDVPALLARIATGIERMERGANSPRGFQGSTPANHAPSAAHQLHESYNVYTGRGF